MTKNEFSSKVLELVPNKLAPCNSITGLSQHGPSIKPIKILQNSKVRGLKCIGMYWQKYSKQFPYVVSPIHKQYMPKIQ